VEFSEIMVEAISLSLTEAAPIEGDTLTLSAAATPDNATDGGIVWSSSDVSVATVDSMGKVIAVAPGSAAITAAVKDNGQQTTDNGQGTGASASCEVTVSPACYAITYLVDDEVFKTDSIARGASISVPEAPVKEGYIFSGWSEVPETMPAGDITVNGSFKANKYLVTFKIGEEVISADSLEYNTAVTAPEAPAKEGYTFSGWGEVADVVPAHDLAYEGSYTVNSYQLIYVVDGETIETVSVEYGTAIMLKDAPIKEGYIFSGWNEVPETMPAMDIVVTGHFEADGIGALSADGLVDVYTLQGVTVKLQISVAELRYALPKGVYIVNGKRIAIK
jgi:hypothetical protein